MNQCWCDEKRIRSTEVEVWKVKKHSGIESPLYRVVGCSGTISVAFRTVSLCFWSPKTCAWLGSHTCRDHIAKAPSTNQPLHLALDCHRPNDWYPLVSLFSESGQLWLMWWNMNAWDISYLQLFKSSSSSVARSKSRSVQTCQDCSHSNKQFEIVQTNIKISNFREYR